jgi:N-acetyl sugar amidotransferase
MKYCTKCLMPDTRPRIRYNEHGVCNACVWTEEKRKINWDERKNELEQLCDKYRSRNSDHFDVIVPYSGGKNGAYIAYSLKEKFGMHPLCITIRPPVEDPICNINIHNFLIHGYDHIHITPNQVVGRIIDKEEFITGGRPMHSFMINVQTAIFRSAVLFNVPFVMFAEEGETEYGGDIKLKNKSTYDMEDSINLYLSGVNPDKYRDRFSEKELYWWRFPAKEDLVKLQPAISHWSYFEDFVNYEHYLVAKEKLGLQERQERSIGTYDNFSATDTYLIWLYFYLMYLKFGFGRTTSEVGCDIRRGALNRKQGLALVKKFDGEYPEPFIEDYLKFYDMTKEEFDTVLDRHANRNLFVKKDGRWIPTFTPQ